MKKNMAPERTLDEGTFDSLEKVLNNSTSCISSLCDLTSHERRYLWEYRQSLMTDTRFKGRGNNIHHEYTAALVSTF